MPSTHEFIQSLSQVIAPPIITHKVAAYAVLRHSQQEYCFRHSDMSALALETHCPL